MDVSCDNGQSFNNLDIAYPTPGFITVSGIETPATCTVTEDPVPGAPTNYHWGTTVIGAGVSVTYGQETTPNVNVTNPLIRNTAGLTVTKIVTGGPAGYTGTFTVDVSCDNGQSFNNLDIAYPTPGFITVSGIETPATCTVTEDPVPGAPTNYHWGTTVIGAGVSVTYGQETTPNVNGDRPVGNLNTAGLTVTKIVTGGPAGYTGTFTVDVSCDNGQSFNNLDIAYPMLGFITVSGIQTPATCTVTEDPVPGAPTNYHWGTTVIGAGVSVTYGQETTPNVNVTNPLIRNTAGSWSPKNVTGGPAGYTGTFTVDVSCDNGQSFNNLDIAYPTPGFITVSGVETPATCTVTGDRVPGGPTNYHWGTTGHWCRRQRHLRPGDDAERQRDEPADPQHRGAHGHQDVRDRWTCRLHGHVHRGRLV